MKMDTLTTPTRHLTIGSSIMHVCMLTSTHSPFDDRVFHREAKSLAKLGYEVTIIAPSTESIDRETEVDSIKIIPTPGYKSKLLVRLIALYYLLLKALKVNPDVYHCHEPDSLLVGILIKLFTNRRVIYDAHECYPSMISENPAFPRPIKPFIKFVIDRTEKLACCFVDHVITVNAALRDRYIDKKVTILYNCPGLKLYNLKPDRIDLKYDNSVVAYEGGVSEDRGLDKFLLTLLEVKEKFPNITFLVIGEIFDSDEFRNWVDNYIKEKDLAGNFRITGWVPYEDVPRYLSAADIGVILFQPTHYNNLIGLPNKLFEYMACEKPVVASDFPEIRRIVRESKCGLLVDPTNPKEIAHAIVHLLEHPEEAKEMGQNGRRAVKEKYNWERMEKILLGVYEGL